MGWHLPHTRDGCTFAGASEREDYFAKASVHIAQLPHRLQRRVRPVLAPDGPLGRFLLAHPFVPAVVAHAAGRVGPVLERGRAGVEREEHVEHVSAGHGSGARVVQAGGGLGGVMDLVEHEAVVGGEAARVDDEPVARAQAEAAQLALVPPHEVVQLDQAPAGELVDGQLGRVQRRNAGGGRLGRQRLGGDNDPGVFHDGGLVYKVLQEYKGFVQALVSCWESVPGSYNRWRGVKQIRGYQTFIEKFSAVTNTGQRVSVILLFFRVQKFG